MTIGNKKNKSNKIRTGIRLINLNISNKIKIDIQKKNKWKETTENQINNK